MKMRNMLLASAMTILPLAGYANPVDGLYVGAGAGVNLMQQMAITSITGRNAANQLVTINTNNLNMQMGAGAAGVGSVGWGFGNGLRAELEFAYRYNGINSFSGPGGTVNIPPNTSGKEQKFGPMVNVFYDFNGLSLWVVPYIGLGAGYQWANLNASGGGSSGNTTKGAFAGQAIVGAALPIPSVPGLSVTGEYRFLALASGDRTYNIGTGSARFGNDFNHAIMIGLRYEFGYTAAPAPMPVADMGAKTFLVFFDWDKADLTARSQGIVQDAAAYSTHTQYTRIDVDGNTDTSGTPSYNQGLSERRAHRVAEELVRDGVPQSAIPCMLMATRSCWSPPDRVCASRKTAALKSSSTDYTRRLNREREALSCASFFRTSLMVALSSLADRQRIRGRSGIRKKCRHVSTGLNRSRLR